MNSLVGVCANALACHHLSCINRSGRGIVLTTVRPGKLLGGVGSRLAQGQTRTSSSYRTISKPGVRSEGTSGEDADTLREVGTRRKSEHVSGSSGSSAHPSSKPFNNFSFSGICGDNLMTRYFWQLLGYPGYSKFVSRRLR